MKNFLFTILCITLFSLNANATSLQKISPKNNTSAITAASNQIAFSLDALPFWGTVNVYCEFNNYADLSANSYIYASPYSSYISSISHETCDMYGCYTMYGPKIYLGMSNTLVKFSGVNRKNQALIFTNYSDQNLDIFCWY